MQTNQQGDFFFINTTTKHYFSLTLIKCFFVPGEWTRTLDSGVTLYVCLPLRPPPFDSSAVCKFHSLKKNVVSWHNPGGENILTTTLLWKQFGNIGYRRNFLGERLAIKQFHLGCSLFVCLCLLCNLVTSMSLNFVTLFLRTTVHLQTRTLSKFSAALSKRPADMFSSYSNSWLY